MALVFAANLPRRVLYGVVPGCLSSLSFLEDTFASRYSTGFSWMTLLFFKIGLSYLLPPSYGKNEPV